MLLWKFDIIEDDQRTVDFDNCSIVNPWFNVEVFGGDGGELGVDLFVSLETIHVDMSAN